ncbi:hypothetical protein ES703_89057 [subsurface metagenome]
MRSFDFVRNIRISVFKNMSLLEINAISFLKHKESIGFSDNYKHLSEDFKRFQYPHQKWVMNDEKNQES